MPTIFRLLTVLFCATLTAQSPMPAETREDPRPPWTELVRKLRSIAEQGPIVVAHRGNSSVCPENTVPAFELAVADRADMIELDVHQTADGVLVCIHDSTVDRTTDGVQQLGLKKQRVDALDYETLSKLDAGSWKATWFANTRLPTLATALEVIQSGSIAMIEHKAGDAERYVELLRDKGLVDDVLLQSFDWDFLRRVHALEPRITTGALGPNDEAKRLTPEIFDAVRSTGASMIHWKAKDLTVEDVAQIKRRGYLTCVYTLDDDIALIGAAAMGLDAITTNRPDRLRKLVRDGHTSRK